MKFETLKERREKAIEKIEKKFATIAKKTATREKKIATLEKKFGITYDPKMNYNSETIKQFNLSDSDAWDAVWMTCEIENLADDLERLPREIEETRKIVAKYDEQIAGAIERERMFLREVPEILKTLQVKLVEEWDAYDKKRREILNAKYRELGYREFLRKYTGADYNFIYQTEEIDHRNNERDAEMMIVDLVNRVKEITGEITDWEGITATAGTNGIPVLNGLVIGKAGRAYVESILAGGWNVQRLHVRVLVTEIH